MKSDLPSFPPFGAPYVPDDGVIAARLLETARLKAEQDARIDRTAARLVAAIRANDDRLGGVEDMLREFALSTKEGLALMVLAKALLRVPDARTADQFIEDKIVPLIAETGGINAMIVDATALPEQVADEVVMSAFRSASQRCSATGGNAALLSEGSSSVIPVIARSACDEAIHTCFVAPWIASLRSQ